MYLTLERFAPKLLPHFFPALRHRPDVPALVHAEVDVESIYTGTRLPGAPDGPDASGDEAHFNSSELATHVASGLTDYGSA